MAVTLPFLLLLLDYWPLGRLNGTKPRSSIAPSAIASRSSIRCAHRIRRGIADRLSASPARSTIAALWRLILEKIPLLAIAGLFCLLTVRGQEAAALEVNRQYSLRVADRQRADFLRRLPGPVFLPGESGAVLSPAAAALPPWQVAAAVLTLAAITLAALRRRRQRPYLLVGWLWYVGMLVPVIGLVQFGARPRPIGSPICPRSVCASPWRGPRRRRWGTGRARTPKEGETRRKERGRRANRRLAAGVLVSCLPLSPSPPLPLSPSPLSPLLFFPDACTAVALAVLIGWGWRQTRLWRTSMPLWCMLYQVYAGDAVAHDSFGNALTDVGPPGRGHSFTSRWRSHSIRFTWGRTTTSGPRCPAAANSTRPRALSHGPVDRSQPTPRRTTTSATCWPARARSDEATVEYRLAVKFKPYNAEARYHLGVALKRARPGDATGAVSSGDRRVARRRAGLQPPGQSW